MDLINDNLTTDIELHFVDIQNINKFYKLFLSIAKITKNNTQKKKSIQMAQNVLNVTFFPFNNIFCKILKKISEKLSFRVLFLFNDSHVLIGKVNCYEEVVHVNKADLPVGIYYIKMTITDKVVVKKVAIQ